MTISRAAMEAMRQHARATPDVEVCGLIFGAKDRIDAVRPVANIADTPETWFELDPQALFSAIRAERSGGPALLGYYHSHPNGRASPSAHDAAMACDSGKYWLIVAKDEITAWHVDQPGQLNPVELALASDEGQRQ